MSFWGWPRLQHYGAAQRTPDAGLRAQAYCQRQLSLAQPAILGISLLIAPKIRISAPVQRLNRLL